MASIITTVGLIAIAARTVLSQHSTSLSSQIPVTSPSQLQKVVVTDLSGPQPVIVEEPITTEVSAIETAVTHAAVPTTSTISGSVWVHTIDAYTSTLTLYDTVITRWVNFTATPCNGGMCTIAANPKLSPTATSTADTTSSGDTTTSTATTSTAENSPTTTARGDTTTSTATTSTAENSPTTTIDPNRLTDRVNIIRRVVLSANANTKYYQTIAVTVSIPYSHDNVWEPCKWAVGNKGHTALWVALGRQVNSASDMGLQTLGITDGGPSCNYNGTLNSDGSLNQPGMLICEGMGIATQCRRPKDSGVVSLLPGDSCGRLYAVCDFNL